ncbi:glycosyltransferase [Jeotgalibaca sp. MA1X17-3]|uniref:glycosyltransferase family 2 protein n=1 Tax=Jeotgalibaca sp. MA1X17-3 TaxID=2908211 RepID=UPI001F244F03|nr:glycosyltransferase [Jeotgalibaca sp. MA1X17-3]UJF15261.1 glycosyltransferase [Jeotgalibaca sp. MA1X17-3]
MIKVSIIVPVYNVEKYLKKSIESLMNQTLKDIEIILVNDGSTDNSLFICKQYEKKDFRIKVIDKNNGGVSSARNIGIELASGQYIGFIDPDDWIEPEMYEKMYSKIEKTKSDVCICNYIKEKNKKKFR